MVVSNSTNEGRNSTGMDRRAYSTARIGVAPRTKEQMATRITWRNCACSSPEAFQARGHRSNHSITEQNAEESSHQSRGYLLAHGFRRAADGLHRNDHPQNGGYDAQPRQRIGHRMERGHRFVAAAALHVDIEIHQLVQFVRRGRADDHHAQRIANELADFAVAQKTRITAENLAVLGSLHVSLECHDAGAPHEAEYLEEHPQMKEKRPPAMRRREKSVTRTPHHFADQPGTVGDKDGAARGADHDQQFGRLEEDPGIPFFQQITAENRDEYRDNTYKSKHRSTLRSNYNTSSSLIGRFRNNPTGMASPLDSLGERGYRTPKGLRKEARKCSGGGSGGRI